MPSRPTPGPPTELATGMPPDAPSTTVGARTSATPEQLWPLLVDPSAPAPFSAEFDGADWKPTRGVEPPSLGARFIGRNSTRDRSWTTLSTVTVHDPPHRFGWTVQALDDPVADWVFEIDRVGDDHELSLTVRLGPSPLSGLSQAIEADPSRAEEFTERRLASLRRSMRRTVEGLAARAEDGSRETPR